MVKLFSYIRIIRPLNVVSGAIAILFSAFIVEYRGPIELVILSMLVVVFFTIGANVLNDFYDYDVDKINRPDRAIITGDVPKIHALYISIFSFIIGILISFQLNQLSQLISIGISFPLLVFYNVKLKNYPLIGNIIVAFILGLSFIYAGSVFKNIKPLIVPSFLAFGLTLIREIVKDIADIEGDRTIGSRTFPIVFGKGKAIKLCAIFSLILSIGSFMLFLNGYYNFYYGLFLIMTVEIPLGIVVISLINKPTIETAKRGVKLLKICTLGGLFSIYIGTI
jgi:geranylgeranylglycerol-phosphate geranylgeranyltransferase